MPFSKFLSAYEDYYKHPACYKVNSSWICVSKIPASIRIHQLKTFTKYFKRQVELGRSPYRPASKCELNEVSSDYSDGKLSLRLAAWRLRFNYDSLAYRIKRKNFSFRRAAQELYQGGRSIELLPWDGEEKSRDEWAECLGISVSRFNGRVRAYGLCERTFAPKGSLRVYQRYCNPQQGEGVEEVDAWGNFNDLPVRQIEPLDSASARVLIYACIVDAADNVTKENKYASDSREFLLNEGGGLEYLLEVLDELDTDYMLGRCRDMVEHPEDNCSLSSCLRNRTDRAVFDEEEIDVYYDEDE